MIHLLIEPDKIIAATMTADDVWRQDVMFQPDRFTHLDKPCIEQVISLTPIEISHARLFNAVVYNSETGQVSNRMISASRSLVVLQ